MAETPSWLVDESIPIAKSAASNPTAQKAAKAAVAVVVEEESSKFFSNPGGDLEAPLNPGGNNSEPADEEESGDSLKKLNISPVELKELEKWNLILRVSYMGMSILMATAAFLALETSTLGGLFVALYVFAFSIIICCFELSLKGIASFIAENLGFLYTKTGRLIFMIFVAVMCFDLKIFGKVCMALLLLLVCINIYVFLTHPKYEEWLRRKHFSHVLDKK